MNGLSEGRCCILRVCRAVAWQILAVVFTFGSTQPGIQAMVLSLLAAVFQLVHKAASPMQSPVSNALQMVRLVCVRVCVRVCVPGVTAVRLFSLPA